ncbi:MAG: LysM peptidoglycan-binding domain-containing protein [Verrucomicrobia bacterium]|nr:LysM peptidoglycan-binding domain-containing protein [Verrucomicrobiota bacterium]
MNPRTIPVKRTPVQKGLIKRINAVVRHCNQRVGTAAEDLSNIDLNPGLSRGIAIILAIHVVAIGLYFVHLKFLNDHAVKPNPTTSAPAAKARPDKPTALAPDDTPCIVVAGDSYARIAAREGVNENDLRAANGNRPIAAGSTLKLPLQRVVAKPPPEVETLLKVTPTPAGRGVVETEPAEPDEVPRGLVVHPKNTRGPTPPKASPVNATKASAGTAKRSYVVRTGDNLWRISKRFKTDQSALMAANGISDPNKLKTGMTLVIPP